MLSCKLTTTPLTVNEKFSFNSGSKLKDPSQFKSLIGSLIYVCSLRLDIMYFVNLLSRFMKKPTHLHFTTRKRVLKYLKGTLNFGICYTRNPNFFLTVYSDNDRARNVNDFKSTSSYIFTLGIGVFSWNSHKQSIIAQSTVKLGYISTAVISNQAIWLRKLLTDLQFPQKLPTPLLVDNKSAIAITKNPIF